MGGNMQRCAETMQNQITIIIKVITFMKDLILPQDVKERMKQEMDILEKLEKEKEEQLKEMMKMKKQEEQAEKKKNQRR
jgi:hypothetical protein